MRPEIQQYLHDRPEELIFVRLHPEWYRILSRSPWETGRLKKAADLFYGRTMSQRLDRFSENAAMISMLMSMAQSMTSKNTGE
ncbi:YlbE-like family protein [Sporolactobacillus sp. Y61]|jgi:hypothetical protein|uniref:YlbE-like family protein n=1 Tax=Sporolactobacillus sp. Y61 TaxID=3160863 RepID=A0AAU8IBV4_9BACL|nr:YlbE-like family protein [Sporolactobacillus sp. THM19-2]RYL92855.1 hypothetical protein EWH91_06050 [Sporolactobacillus sp. THM19-2]